MNTPRHILTRRQTLLLEWGAAIGIFYVLFAMPSHPQWEGSLGYLIQNPLGVSLNVIMLAAIALYSIHHRLSPQASH
jgi:fumarate reductase subunit C